MPKGLCNAIPTFLGVRFPDAGYNVVQDNTCFGFPSGTSKIVVDTKLGPLRNDWGPNPTLTHALIPGSPAIDWVPQIKCITHRDQRNLHRPAGSACDAGAYEYQP
jgi:hypothetical protein